MQKRITMCDGLTRPYAKAHHKTTTTIVTDTNLQPSLIPSPMQQDWQIRTYSQVLLRSGAVVMPPGHGYLTGLLIAANVSQRAKHSEKLHFAKHSSSSQSLSFDMALNQNRKSWEHNTARLLSWHHQQRQCMLHMQQF